MKTLSLSASRRNTFFSIVTWMLMSISTTILYRYIENAPLWNPTDLNYIDTIYEVISVFTIVIIGVHIVHGIFREIEHSFLAEGAVIRRFLPLIKVCSLSLVWIFGGFYILDNLHVNTSSILTGAGI